MIATEKYETILNALAEALEAKNRTILVQQYQLEALNEKLTEIEKKENAKNEAV